MDARRVDIQPIVGEHVGALDDEQHGQEVSVAEAVCCAQYVIGRGRVEFLDQVAQRQSRDDVRAPHGFFAAAARLYADAANVAALSVDAHDGCVEAHA